VSIFNMGFSSTFGDLDLTPCVHNSCQRPSPQAVTFQVQSASRDGIIENGDAL